MRAVEKTIRQLLVIAPAMVSVKVTIGCQETWPGREDITEFVEP